MTEYRYIGEELSLFAQAVNWKRYYSGLIQPYLTGDVLEVGAGLGANTRFLKSPGVSSWTCLEPDAEMAEQMRTGFMEDKSLADCRVVAATTESLGRDRRFDAVLYLDVLEHIAEDREELQRAANLLRAGGRLIVLAPAHQWLFTAFDSAIGHYRRYDRPSLRALTPPGCRPVRLLYLDSAGMLASLANRIFLQQRMPKKAEILLWDRVLVRFSRIFDKVCIHSLGKSLLVVWQKEDMVQEVSYGDAAGVKA